ncbi:ABC transporter substrate-binding protein [Paenibacillus sp. LPE1-1-1.1]|uniref:ABC transporter substrate-binding protein n=1 Tax=Paenibacillus sp. LPE1-1-1.1 TaxID=3135230 RepID=UPI0034334BF1
MKKWLVTALALMLAFGILSACGSANNEEKTNESNGSKNAAEDAAKDVTLNVMHFMIEKPKVEAFEKMTEAFSAKHPNIKFNIEIVASDKYNDALKMKIAGGDVPDIMFGRPNTMIDFLESGVFMDITDESFAQKINKTYIPNVSYKERVYGLPLDLMTNGVIYNKDLFEQAGVAVPMTWTEFVAACEQLKAKGITPFAGAFQQGVSYISYLYPDIFGSTLKRNPSFPAQLISGEKKWTDLQDIRGLLDRVSTMMPYLNEDYRDIDYEKSLQYFATGKAAMTVIGSFAIGTIRQYNPEGNFGVFTFPAYDNAEDNVMTHGTDNTFLPAANSKNKEEMLQFFEFMASEEGGQIWADGVQTISALNPDLKPATQDSMAADFQKLYQTGKIINNGAEPTFYAQWDEITWRLLGQYMMQKNPADRKPDEVLNNLDKEFEKARKMG